MIEDNEVMPRDYVVGPSQIHGFGVFAARDLKQDEIVGYIHCKAFNAGSVKTPPITAVQTSDGEMLAVISGFPLWYVNTAHTAHLPTIYVSREGERDRALVRTARRVKKGEELTTGWRAPWRV